MKKKPISFLVPILLLDFAGTACASSPGGRGAAKAPGEVTLSFAGDCTVGTVNSPRPLPDNIKQAKNDAGALRNDYQPVPVFGQAAGQVAALVLKRSVRLRYGVKHLTYGRQRKQDMLPENVYRYLLIDLESAPDVLGKMLETVADLSVYDHRPDPERFTLREVLAHLADWNTVFLGRMKQTRDDADPTLQGLDEGQVARDHDYAHADPVESLERHKANRAELVTFLRTLSPAQWEQSGIHTEIGPITLTVQAVLVGAHDGYHRQQVVCYVSGGKTEWEKD